ncbi:MAG: aminotransferase class I/II-fold pyridoxal phosphate-dependent enzyme, partial [Rikenellaceae bacterium]|nr:aminotransferase class I/II-fold pyridoxal phosphate-dependent enzyme [Rikenellaceae bacterium]
MDIRLADRLSSVGEYWFSGKLREIARMKEAGRDIISLGIGSPDMAPAPSVVERLSSEAAKADAHGYQPYAGTAELRTAFARWYGERYGVS